MKPLLILMLGLMLSSCCLSKKFKTETETTIITKIDTVIKFVPDTIIKIKTVELHDTAFIESDVAEARSYFDTVRQKIVLSLKGKIIDVPIAIDQVIKTKEKKSEYKNCITLSQAIIALISFIFVISLFAIGITYVIKKFRL